MGARLVLVLALVGCGGSSESASVEGRWRAMISASCSLELELRMEIDHYNSNLACDSKRQAVEFESGEVFADTRTGTLELRPVEVYSRIRLIALDGP